MYKRRTSSSNPFWRTRHSSSPRPSKLLCIDYRISTVSAHCCSFSPLRSRADSRCRLVRADQARYLFVRLYLRKSAWIRLRGIDYERDIEDLERACGALWEQVAFTPSRLPTPPPPPPVVEECKPAAVNYPDMIDLTGDDDDEDVMVPLKEEEAADLTAMALGKDQLALESPEVILGLLSIDELVALGKRMKVNPGKGSVSSRAQSLGADFVGWLTLATV